MSEIVIKNGNNAYTLVPNNFIDKHMPAANGEFIKVYFYLLRHQTSVAITDIADRLNLTENDVTRALRYWNDCGVLSVSFNNDVPVSVGFSDSSSQPEQPDTNSDEDIEQLLYIIEMYIERPLTKPEISTILHFYNDFCFSADLIEYLVTYCIKIDRMSFPYMEKVAETWHEHDIIDVTEAKEFVEQGSKRVRTVMKGLGISGRSVTPDEIAMIDRWYDELGFEDEMVEEACKRTATDGNSTCEKVDKLLRKWHKGFITDMADLAELEYSLKRFEI